MYKPNSKKMLTVVITIAMVFSVFAILGFAAEPGYAAPATNFTLSPNTIYASGTDTQFAVVSSSMSFPNNVPLYYEWSSTGSWSGTGTVWFTLSGTTIASGTLTPSLTASSGTYYFLVSSEASGASGVFASNPITVSTSAPSVSSVQSSGIVGSTVNVTGSGYADNSTVNIYFLYDPSSATSLTSANMVASATASAKGVLKASFSVPTTQYGTYGIIAIDTNGTSTEYAYSSALVWYSSFSVVGSLTVSYPSGNSIYTGQSFSVAGTGFVAAGTVTISDNDINASGTLKTTPSTITVGSDGSFTATVLTMGATFASLTTSPLATTVSATESGVSSAPTATLNVTAASITISPGTISPGGSFTVTGSNFYPGGKINANSITVASSSYSATLSNSAVTVSSTGTFSLTASTLTFTGSLASNNKQTVTAPEALPTPVTVGGSSTYSATGQVNISAPQVTVSYPSGYSLTASENVTVSGTNFFPGSTIAANSITIAGKAGTNTAVVVSSSGSFSTLFTVPSASALSGVSLGVKSLTVTQITPGGLRYENETVSVNAIYSQPTVNDTGIEVSLSTSASATTSLTQQNVGTTIYYYLFGYPASQTVSVFMGQDQVASNVVTDANGAYSGSFTIPAMPGSTSGISYTVQTQSMYGLQAHTPSTISVSPVFTISGTESYFTSYSYLAANDYFNITGTGYGALAAVSLQYTLHSTDSNFALAFVASSVETNVDGSFTAEAQVTSSTGLPLVTNNMVGLTVSTASASYNIPDTMPAFYVLGTPTLTLSDTTSGSSQVGTTGDTITATIANVVSNSIVPISYSVTGSLGKSLTGLTSSSDTGTITVTYAVNGTVTETLAANITGFPGTTTTFLVSIPGSTGFLLNATGGHSISSTLGGSFVVYAVGFGKSSYVNLGATGSLSLSGGSQTKAVDGGVVFSAVTIPTSATVGTYLIYGQQAATSGGAPTYTTGLTSSLVVSFPANLTLSVYTGSIGTSVTLTAYGIISDNFYNLYFGSILLTSSPVQGSALPSSFTVPTVAPGTYNVSVIPVGSTTPTASAGFTVTATTVFSLSVDAPVAFPGQLVTFAWPVAGTSVFSAGSSSTAVSQVTVTVYLNGTAFDTIPVSPNVGTSNTWLNGSFQMPNDNVGTYWTLTLSYMQTQYTAGKTVSGSTAAGAYIQLVSGKGALLTGITSNQTATLLADINSTVKTSMKVPLSELNATVVKLNSTSAEITTAFGNMTATLKAINATVASIEAGQVVVQTSLGTIKTSLASLNATLTSVSGNVATINTAVGAQTTALSNINATVTSNGNKLVTVSTDLGTLSGTITSVSSGVANIQTQMGTIQTNVSQIAGYTSHISNSTKALQSGYGTLEVFLVVIIVLVLITLVMAFMAVNAANKASRRATEEKKQ